MNALISNTPSVVTMTSLELVDFINSQRKEGEPELRHDNFLAKVPQVLGEEVALSFKGYYKALNGKQNPLYEFPKREACLMAMSYSYDIQAKVFDRMTELEAEQKRGTLAVPNFSNPAEAARAWADQYEARLLAEQTKAQIGHRREATAMATASTAVRKAEKLQIQLDQSKQFASVKRIEGIFKGHKFDWRLLKDATAELSLKAIDVFDANYGTVKAWPAASWLYAYAVQLTEDGAEIVCDF